MLTLRRIVVMLLIAFAATAIVHAAEPNGRDLPPGLQIPDAARTGPNFDVDRATEAYLNLLNAEQRAQSDAYFEGGYWLRLWGLLYGLAVSAIFLFLGLSRRLRDIARRISQRPWIVVLIYAPLYLLVGFLLGLPEAIYTDFIREHQYGLATQTFGAWFADRGKGLAVSLILGPIVLGFLYAAVRRAGARWWIWATAVTFVFALFAAMISPVYISPLFNKYQALADGPVRSAVLSLARANQIPTDHVEWFDASRQTTRVSANVSGFAGTTRVNLNDNLLNKTSLPEIKAVMGHEMGHYVLNHGFRLVIYLTLVLGAAFWITHRLLDRALVRWGAAWGLENRADPAALPLVTAILSLPLFFATPLLNSIVRQAEAEADMFGLNAAREPHGFAMAAMRLSTYRKIHPGWLEEIVFYDHPSGYARVHGSMLWLKENQDNPTANAAATDSH